MIVATYCVKNEEEFLEESLQATLAAVDRAVVFDDNSTDHTAEIAQSYPQVHYLPSPWKDYHEARNRAYVVGWALENLNPKWLLTLDGDEVLDNPADIRRLASAREECYRGRVLTFWNDRQTIRVDGDFRGYEAKRLYKVWNRRIELKMGCKMWANGGRGKCGLHAGYLPCHWKPGEERFYIRHYGLLTAERRREKWELYNRIDDSAIKQKNPTYYDHLIGKPSYFTPGPVELKRWVV